MSLFVWHYSCLFAQITFLNNYEMQFVVQFVVEEIMTKGVSSLNEETSKEVLDRDW